MVLTARYAAGRYDRLTALAADLVRSKVDVLVTPGSEATVAATRATSTVPIVMLEVGDPVVHGLVASLLRPGGNVTGVSGIFSDLAPVHLELLRLAVPGASRVAVLWNPDNVAEHRLWTEKQTTARVFGWQLVTAPMSRMDDVEVVLRRALARRADALYSLGDPLILSERQQIANFALQHRLPTLFRLAGVRGRRRLHGLRSQLVDPVSAGRRLRRPDLTGCPPRRPPRRAAAALRAGRQSEDGACPRHPRPGRGAESGRRGGRVRHVRAAARTRWTSI